jgi:hypothetical protein
MNAEPAPAARRTLVGGPATSEDDAVSIRLGARLTGMLAT